MNTVTMHINGRKITRDVPPHFLLLDFLRNEMGLTGTKEACSVGVCGLCTVLVNGRTTSSCLLPVVCVNDAEVYTAEGCDVLLEINPEEIPAGAPNLTLWQLIQDAFVHCEGTQCGICTSGQVMSALALLQENPSPTDADIRHFMAGNLCRCTGYQSIIAAIETAAERWRTVRGNVRV